MSYKDAFGMLFIKSCGGRITCGTDYPIEITSDDAKAMLMKNKSNRKIKPLLVKKYQNQIERNLWQDHSQIIVNNSGELLDGQHRLTACSQSGTTIKAFLVCSKVGTPLELACDIGGTRSGRDYSCVSDSVTDMAGAVCRMYLKPHEFNQIAQAKMAEKIHKDIIGLLGDDVLCTFASARLKPFSSAPLRVGALWSLYHYEDISYVLSQVNALRNLEFGSMSKYMEVFYKKYYANGKGKVLYKPYEQMAMVAKSLDPERREMSRFNIENGTMYADASDMCDTIANI